MVKIVQITINNQNIQQKVHSKTKKTKNHNYLYF